MNKLHNEDEIIELINNNSMAVVYFTGMDCGACEVIKFKVENILRKHPEIKSGEINGEEEFKQFESNVNRAKGKLAAFLEDK